ncbi:MAG TPA: hypothetical protein VD969_19725 [Symbiobacteriaceae bacterium]|nr:hypothetical protein [Symbiobacteriaceae bacterium]
MAKPYVQADAFFLGVVTKVVLTERRGNDLIQLAIEIPLQEWVNDRELNALRGQICTFRTETVRMEDVKDADLRKGKGPRPPIQQ